MVNVGYQFGLTGKRDIIGGAFLALTFSAVIFLIVDLDRATEGNIQLRQQQMLDLQKQMQSQTQQAIEAEKSVKLKN